MATILVKLLPKMAIFGQAASYIGRESNYSQKWQQFESNYFGNIWTSCVLYRKQIKLLPKMAKFESNYCQIFGQE